jgi:hypothetical protein
MFKLYLADVNYNIISPIDISNGAITKLTLDTNINQARELTINATTYLDEMYDFLLLPETCLVLELENHLKQIQKIGFSKSNNIVTDLLPYANIGSGSDYNSCVRLDNSVIQDIDYTITNDILSDNQLRIAKYITTNKQYQKKYYRIKPFNFSNITELNENNEKQAKQRLYNEATNYLESIKNQNSIDSQIKRQNGLLELKFYSSSLDLNTSKRVINANIDYQASCSNFVSQLDSNFIFEVLDDVEITLNTGMYSNFELLNEVVKNRNLSWREIGLVTDSNNQIKTKIQIGNFDKLQPTILATNPTIDSLFDDYSVRIDKVTAYYPSLKVSLDVQNFIQEGENIQVEYKEFQEQENGTQKEIFNISKIQNYTGGSLELYNIL